jgi:LysR family transcriptional regulator, glycine cleavage system transcriptional activator
MALRLPPLPSLRLFEAAGRHVSFKLAAEELGITPSAVSHGIVALERWLGVALFERGARGLSLTAAGTEYLPYISEALSMIATGTQRLPSRRADRRIRVSCAPTFASRWLLPGLQRFRERHPGIAIEIDTSHRQVGFPVDGVDLAIRMGRGPWPGLASTLLVDERLVPVCAPAYRNALALGADRGTGGIDLARATLIHVTSVSEDWAAWAEAAGLGNEPGTGTGIDLAGGLRFDTVHLAFEAAAAGLGVAIGRRPLVDYDLMKGTLVEATGPVVESATAYWLVGAETTQGRPDIAAFKRWLVEETARL